MPAPLLWMQLGATAAVILLTARFLTNSADVIAEKAGLGRSFVGVVMLATATSLPELGTGVSSIVLIGVPDLAAGDAFGANLVNLLIVGLLDLYWRNGPLLNAVSSASVLVAGLGITITSLAAAAILIHHGTDVGSGWYVSPISVIMLGVFAVGMYLVYRHASRDLANQADHEAADTLYAKASLSRAAATYALTTAVIVGASVLLAKTGDSLAHAMGWDASFVGTQFLAISTTLPELATSIAAIRLNAPELAMANLLGSNMFNHGVVLFVDDAVYTEGVLWQGISKVHAVTSALVILMTSVVIVGLIWRPRKRPSRFWTPEAVGLIALYVVSSVLVFRLS